MLKTLKRWSSILNQTFYFSNNRQRKNLIKEAIQCIVNVLSNILNSKGNAKNDFILIHFEKGVWLTLIMNKITKNNFLQNMNKIFIVTNTTEVAEIQVLRVILS